MTTFKYQEGVSHDELMAVAAARLDRAPRRWWPTAARSRAPAASTSPI